MSDKIEKHSTCKIRSVIHFMSARGIRQAKFTGPFIIMLMGKKLRSSGMKNGCYF